MKYVAQNIMIYGNVETTIIDENFVVIYEPTSILNVAMELVEAAKSASKNGIRIIAEKELNYKSLGGKKFVAINPRDLEEYNIPDYKKIEEFSYAIKSNPLIIDVSEEAVNCADENDLSVPLVPIIQVRSDDLTPLLVLRAYEIDGEYDLGYVNIFEIDTEKYLYGWCGPGEHFEEWIFRVPLNTDMSGTFEAEISHERFQWLKTKIQKQKSPYGESYIVKKFEWEE